MEDNKSPLVSVILPTYNMRASLAEAMRSALGQTYRNLELIVVDDGSTDDTKSLVNELTNRDKRVRYFYQANGGEGSARRTGIQNALGDLIAFIDADDRWLPNKLARQVPLFASPRVGLVYADAINTFEDGRTVLSSAIGTFKRGHIFAALVRRNFMCNSSVMVRRAAIDALGLPDERRELRVIADYDLWLRITSVWKADFVDEPLVDITFTQKIASREDKLRAQQNLLTIYKKLGGIQLTFAERVALALRKCIINLKIVYYLCSGTDRLN